MIYRNSDFPHEAAQTQLKAIDALVARLGDGAAYTIGHTHISKSVLLPVPTIVLPGLTFMLRDNFYDLNLLVISEKEINLPLDFFYTPKDFAWYLGEVERKRNYCFSDWTDEEMNDSRILRVRRKNGNGWSEMRGHEKDRWADRMTSTEWYGNDWASGVLIPRGPSPFSEDTIFYHARKAYAEGIPSYAKPYTGPCEEFLNSVDSWEAVTRICTVIAGLSQ